MWLYVPTASIGGQLIEHAFERLRRDSFTSLCGLVEQCLPPNATTQNYEGRMRCALCEELVRGMETMKLTQHFSLDEFACNDKDKTPVPQELVKNVRELAEQLEVLREALGSKPMRVNSGYRTKAYNRKVGGVRTSQHLAAKAADIVVKGVKPELIYEVARDLMRRGKMKKGGLGLYRSFVHVDTRGRNARWRARGA